MKGTSESSTIQKELAELEEISRGLSEANQHSKRKGRWSSVSEVQKYTDEKVTLKKMRKLVRREEAVEKKKGSKLLRLFRKSGGLGGYNDAGNISIYNRGNDGGIDTRGNRGNEDGGDRRDSESNAGDRTADIVASGVGMALLGGMGGGVVGR